MKTLYVFAGLNWLAAALQIPFLSEPLNALALALVFCTVVGVLNFAQARAMGRA